MNFRLNIRKTERSLSNFTFELIDDVMCGNLRASRELLNLCAFVARDAMFLCILRPATCIETPARLSPRYLVFLNNDLNDRTHLVSPILRSNEEICVYAFDFDKLLNALSSNGENKGCFIIAFYRVLKS